MPEYELAGLTPEQADGGSDGVSRGSTAPAARSRGRWLREARNDKLDGRRELVHVEFFDRRLFDCFGSNAFVAFLHVYFVLGESLAPSEKLALGHRVGGPRRFRRPGFAQFAQCGLLVAGGLVAASGFLERLICGSPDRPRIVDALGFLGPGALWPWCFMACARGLRCAVHCDPDNAKHEKDENKAGWDEHSPPGTLALMENSHLLRTEQQVLQVEQTSEWRRWQRVILVRWILYTTFLLVGAYGCAQLLTREERQLGAIGQAAQTYVTAVGPAGHCRSGSVLTALTPLHHTL